MIRIRKGIALAIEQNENNYQLIAVEIDGKRETAISFPLLAGEVHPGDKLLINTTANFLALGTGSYNIVMGNCDLTSTDISGSGHIIKLRYTPMQLKCLALEEPDSPHRDAIDKFESLNNIPVITAPLHSLISPIAMGFKYFMPSKVVTYIMTDSAALPIAVSDNVRALKKAGLIDHTITSRQAFGGDAESVNLYTALIAAKEAFNSDLVIVAPGPGKVGTSTKYGFSEIEQGEMLNAVNVLGGTAISCLRINTSDSGYRHYGISEHSLTILKKICLTEAHVPIPVYADADIDLNKNVVKELNSLQNVLLSETDVTDADEIFKSYDLKLSTMSKGYEEDKVFFATGLACSKYAIKIIRDNELSNVKHHIHVSGSE